MNKVMAVYNTFSRLFINRLGLSIDGKKRVAGYKICSNFIPAIYFYGCKTLNIIFVCSKYKNSIKDKIVWIHRISLF